MTGVDAGELLALARTVATAAGELVLDGRRRPVAVAETKSSPTDVVTAVDLASERLIRSMVLEARPDDGFVGEEGDDQAGASGVTWVADPIDGTVNYLYGLALYSVSIAAKVGGETVAGVVHSPMLRETFSAARSGGAELNGEAIHVSDCTDPALALIGTGFAYRADVRRLQAEETARLLPRVRDVRRLGSAALDLCFVASGRLDGFVERGLQPWDLAAGELIAREAGAVVGGLGGDPAGERLTVAASAAFFPTLHDLLVDCGYADWPVEAV